jgi:mono/diheme cytochrome c family protein
MMDAQPSFGRSPTPSVTFRWPGETVPPFMYARADMNHHHVACLFLLAFLACIPSADSAADDPINFGKEVAPIFEQHCVRCHSPGNSKGDVSLATLDDLTANEYVVGGDADGSYLIELVTSHGGDPPAMPKEAKSLSDDEVALLRQWINQGATWPSDVVVKEKAKADGAWWSLQSLKVRQSSSLPSTSGAPQATVTDSQAGSLRHDSIDDFIREKLNHHKLAISPQADRRTLIRRLSFDLHGLPPTPEAVHAFVNDPDPHAYELLVDRMLNSPHYGERFAQHWMDVAHYADTHGFERDQRRDNAWRYRDYVIGSFNEDKPYNRFLQEQIAGDVLWPDNDQAVLATGFLAAGPWDFVGQVETKSAELRRAARSLDLDDMATQVMTATMALTINCARCHDHKLDPISQQEYYQLQAVFAGVRRADRVLGDTSLKHHDKEKKSLIQQLHKIEIEIGQLEGAGMNLADIVGGGNGFGTGTYRKAVDPRSAKVQTGDFGKLVNVETNRFSPSDFEFIDGVFVPDGEDGKAKIPVSTTGTTISGLPKTSGDAWDMIRNGPVASQHSTELGGIDFAKDGHALLGLHANAGITFDVAAIRNALVGLEANPRETLRFTAKLGYFGAVGGYHADAWVFVDGRQTAHFPKLKREHGLQKVEIELPPLARFLTLVATDGGNGFSMDQVGFGDPSVTRSVHEELNLNDSLRLAELRAQRMKIDTKLESLGPPPTFYGVVADTDVPDVRLLTRGDPESPIGDALSPGALGALAMLNPILGTIESSEGQRRAALAHWITHPDNPLTRRVIVNRLWHWHFGKGLVDTPSDFGYGGGQPSHPELLDWLAEELARNNWSLKAIHRLIVSSETYRQTSYIARGAGMLSAASQGDQDEPGYELARRIDADNRLLWRQNPRRLEAESVRDAVLFVSGKLNFERGGPGFEDFQYQEAYAPIYTYITADKPELWRRSIYRYIVRTTPNRFLTTLDCPDPANLTPSRMTSTTPLQSLALYNNDFMLRQARYLAERVEQDAGLRNQDQVIRAFEMAFGRQPTERELILSSDLVEQQGLFSLCRSLLNSNEFIYVD